MSISLLFLFRKFNDSSPNGKIRKKDNNDSHTEVVGGKYSLFQTIQTGVSPYISYICINEFFL